MFGLKRFTIRTSYHSLLKPNIDKLFRNIYSMTIQEQFTTSAREFLVLCDIIWKNTPEDVEKMFQNIIGEIEWFDEIIPIDTEGKRTLCFIMGHHDPEYTKLFLYSAREFRCFIEFPVHVRREYGTFSLVGPPGEVERIVDFMKEWGSDLRIAGIMEYNPKDRGVLTVLTEKQRSALKQAYFGGFFDFPRKRDARDISTDLKIRHTTFLTHIRRGQKRIFAHLFQE